MKLAVVGGGPSALYVASRLFSLLKQEPDIRVHVYDRLWSPYGLVRYGVAPDHPEVKNCTHKFDITAKNPGFRFFGNVDVVPPISSAVPSSRLGHTLRLPLTSLLPHYTHLLLSTGCTLPTLHPTIPPSDFCIPALSLVHWYTSHPSNPPAPPLDKAPHVSIIGAGNVSLDVARILLTPPLHLSKYDLPEHVLQVLRRSAVKHVSILARRGPLEAAFTAKELREMMNIPGTSMKPIPRDLLTPPPGKEVTRQQGRILQILDKGSKARYDGSTEKTWSLDFFRSPTRLSSLSVGHNNNNNDDDDGSFLPLSLMLNHTALDPTTHASVPTDVTSEHRTSLVVTSLGFYADPSSTPFYDPELRRLRTLPGGRVIERKNGRVVNNVYASGWAASGAKGVLASTMMDAYSVAETIVEDLNGQNMDTESEEALKIMNPSSSPDSLPAEIVRGLSEGKVVEFKDWKKIDEEEVKRGKEKGKERERMGYGEVMNYLGLA